MQDLSARENILKRIRRSLEASTSKPYPSVTIPDSYFVSEQGTLMEIFERKFTALLGRIFVFDDKISMREKLFQLIQERQWQDVFINDPTIKEWLGDHFPSFDNTDTIPEIDLAITECAMLIARTGTIVLRSDMAAGRALPVYAPVHIVIANANQLIYDLKESMNKIMLDGKDQLPSSLVFASGPSRTGDIEKTLVVGVHGPREVFVFILN